jgi:hypothetical protein
MRTFRKERVHAFFKQRGFFYDKQKTFINAFKVASKNLFELTSMTVLAKK